MESHTLNPAWRTEFRILGYVHEQGFSNINQNPFDSLRKVAVTAVTFFQVFTRPFLLGFTDLPAKYRKGQLNPALSLSENDNVKHKELGTIFQANEMWKEGTQCITFQMRQLTMTSKHHLRTQAKVAPKSYLAIKVVKRKSIFVSSWRNNELLFLRILTEAETVGFTRTFGFQE